MASKSRKRKRKIVLGGTSFLGKRKQKEILFQNDPHNFSKVVHLLIFIEKVINANVEADPSPTCKKSCYLFGVAVQKIWDSFPTKKINAVEVSWFLQHCYSLASQEDNVCVRALLNTNLVLIDSLKELVPSHVNSLRDMEACIFKMLEQYDPNVEHSDSQKLGEYIANTILTFLEKPCTLK